MLDRMQVQYRDTKTGFECIHMPSIDVSSVQPDGRQTGGGGGERTHRKRGSVGSYETDTTKRSLAKKASKLSFKTKMSREKEREPSVGSAGNSVNANANANANANGNGTGGTAGANGKDKELPSRPSGGTILSASASSASSSFFHVSNAHSNTAEGPTTPAPRAESIEAPVPVSVPAAQDEVPSSSSRSQSPVKPKVLPPIPRDFAPSPQLIPPPSPLPTGEVDPDVFDIIGANYLAVRFEINIVKVSCVSLSPLPFYRRPIPAFYDGDDDTDITSFFFFPLLLVLLSHRFPGFHCMAFSSDVQVEMAGNITCLRGGY